VLAHAGPPPARRTAPRSRQAGRGRARLPRGPGALPRERLVALRPHEEPRGAGQEAAGGAGEAALRRRLGIRRRETHGLALLTRWPGRGGGSTALRRPATSPKERWGSLGEPRFPRLSVTPPAASAAPCALAPP